MLIYGQDAQVAAWVCRQLKIKPFPEGLYKAIGIVRDGRDIGGLVWHNYHEDNWGKPLLIEVTLATVDKRWATRHTIRELFAFPFCQLGVKRVQATCHRKAKLVRTILQKLGFSYEGIVRQAHPQGGDAAHYSILRNECFWLKEKSSGEKFTKSTSGARPSCDSGGANFQQQADGSIPVRPIESELQHAARQP